MRQWTYTQDKETLDIAANMGRPPALGGGGQIVAHRLTRSLPVSAHSREAGKLWFYAAKRERGRGRWWGDEGVGGGKASVRPDGLAGVAQVSDRCGWL
jgi:hypothetical protein